MTEAEETARRAIGTRDLDARARITELEAALTPFAELADEIERCAGPNGNPRDWAMACEWRDLVEARAALRKTKHT